MNETHYIHDLKIEIMDINATDCPYRVTNLVTGESFMCLVESSAWHNCEALLAATKSNQEYLLYSLNRPDHEAVKIEPVSEPQTLTSFAVREFPDELQRLDKPRDWLVESTKHHNGKHNGTDVGSLLNYLEGSIDPSTMKVRFRDDDFFVPRIEVETLRDTWRVCIYPFGEVRPEHDGYPSFDGPGTLTSTLDSVRVIASVQLMGVALQLFSDGTYSFGDTSGG